MFSGDPHASPAQPPTSAPAAQRPSGAASISTGQMKGDLKASLRRRYLPLLRPAIPLVIAFAWLHSRGGVPREATQELDRSRALAAALHSDGLLADARDIHWVDPPQGALKSPNAEIRAIARARKPDEPGDIYLVKTKLSPEGYLLDITGLYNLSDTSAVDEHRVVVQGEQVAWAIGGGDKTFSLHWANLGGEPAKEFEGWGVVKRWQHSITNLQKTGQTSGVGRRHFKLEPPGGKVQFSFSKQNIEGASDDQAGMVVQVDERFSEILVGEPLAEGSFIQEQPHHLAQPGNLVTWAVDRVRQSPWFSDDNMQLLKAVAFDALDKLQQVRGSVTGDDGSSVIEEQFKDLPPPVEYTDTETGWPPPPMEPLLKTPLEGEGKWRPLDDDPYVKTNPEAPSPFVTSFIRTDRKRAYTQIFVMLWDPRQVSLHTMSGTIEPKSATGETGPGRVPRTPEVMGRLLAGFNGGFQASHGEFGMMAEDVMYLPPKPYGASVVELRDGSTGFGTWPNDENVPETVVGFRQNMTPLVMDDTINPYKRNWWGGVPPGWKDESRTTRSAICLTKEKFVAYLYGNSIDADHLAFAMQQARCSYGIHLDMNPGHTGLEFYHAAKTGELPDLGRPLDKQWEATGQVRDMPGWSFLGRRMLRYMGLMNFPRYIDRESRDFFYLTLKHILPGTPLKSAFSDADESEGKWVVKGLPQHGWPYAVALTQLRPDKSQPQGKVAIMQLDPRAIQPEAQQRDDAQLVAAFHRVSNTGAAPAGLWHDTSVRGGGGFSILPETDFPTKSASVSLLGRGFLTADAQGKAIKAGACVAKGSGMLYYAETQPGPTALGALQKAFEPLDCQGQIFFDSDLGVAIGGDRNLQGSAVPRQRGGLRMVRRASPGGTRVFTDTPIVPPNDWYPLQAKRVRYFRKPKPAENAEGGGNEAPSTPAPETPSE